MFMYRGANLMIPASISIDHYNAISPPMKYIFGCDNNDCMVCEKCIIRNLIQCGEVMVRERVFELPELQTKFNDKDNNNNNDNNNDNNSNKNVNENVNENKEKGSTVDKFNEPLSDIRQKIGSSEQFILSTENIVISLLWKSIREAQDNTGRKSLIENKETNKEITANEQNHELINLEDEEETNQKEVSHTINEISKVTPNLQKNDSKKQVNNEGVIDDEEKQMERSKLETKDKTHANNTLNHQKTSEKVSTGRITKNSLSENTNNVNKDSLKQTLDSNKDNNIPITIYCHGKIGNKEWGCNKSYNGMENLKKHWATDDGRRCLQHFISLRSGEF